MADPRSGRRYQEFRAKVRAVHALQQRPCSLCGQAIDYRLAWPERFAWSLEHVVPVWRGGQTFDPANVAAAHFTCNASKGAREGNALRGARRRPRPRAAEVQQHTSVRW